MAELQYLNFECTNVRFDFKSFLSELSHMKKLKFLCYDNKEAQKVINHTWMKKLMPNLQINSDSGDSRIASPCLPDYHHPVQEIRTYNMKEGRGDSGKLKLKERIYFLTTLVACISKTLMNTF